MCADITTEGEDRGEIYLDYLSQKIPSVLCPAAWHVLTYLVPIIIRKLCTRMASLNSRAIHQDVDFMSIFQNGRSERCYFGLGGEVCSVDWCFAAEGFNGFLRRGV